LGVIVAKNKEKKKKPSENKKVHIPTGNRGARKSPMDRVSLIVAGKGPYKTLPSVRCSPYGGTSADFGSFDMEQARINRSLGLC
jgi:hypothetical protein